ncbi:MAG: MotA/TolQ/ExbB proton channel family protein, partial [Cyanobacteria bacterium J069]
MSILNLFATGGIVMVPLLGLSILAMALVLERLVFWWQLTRQQDRIIQDSLALYRRSSRAAFQKLEQYANLPMARIFLAALELEQATPDEFRLALESAAQAELPLLRRFNTVFDTVISVAPIMNSRR